MKRIAAVTLALASVAGFGTTVDATASSCSIGKSRYQAAALCNSGSGTYRVGVRQANGAYKYGPIVFVGKASVVSTSSPIVSAWVQKY